MPAPIGTRQSTPVLAPVTSSTSNGPNARFASDPQLKDVLAGKIKLGDKSQGDGLKKVQQAMTDMGFALPNSADGKYGPMTKTSITNFQVNAAKMFPGVKPTGVLDKPTMAALDKLAPAPGEQGQSLNIPKPVFDGQKVRVVVLKDEHRTFIYDNNGKVQKIVQNAVGAKATSTEGGLKLINYKLSEAESVALGKKLWGGAVFGPRILDLKWADGKPSGEELHGTSAPQDLGKDVSHGCVRHSNADISVMANMLNVGDKVAIASGLGDPRLK
jgi:lipoprotein-anchoring transpeptidase ErfK/SrfK